MASFTDMWVCTLIIKQIKFPKNRLTLNVLNVSRFVFIEIEFVVSCITTEYIEHERMKVDKIGKPYFCCSRSLLSLVNILSIGLRTVYAYILVIYMESRNCRKEFFQTCTTFSILFICLCYVTNTRNFGIEYVYDCPNIFIITDIFLGFRWFQ